MARHRLAVALAMLVVSPTTSAWAVPTSFIVGGQVGAPTTDTAASLQALPQTTQAVTDRAGGSTVVDTFTGPTLWSVLQVAADVTMNGLAIINENPVSYTFAHLQPPADRPTYTPRTSPAETGTSSSN